MDPSYQIEGIVLPKLLPELQLLREERLPDLHLSIKREFRITQGICFGERRPECYVGVKSLRVGRVSRGGGGAEYELA